MEIALKKDAFAQYCDPETYAKIVDYPCMSVFWEHCVTEYGTAGAVADGEKLTYADLDGRVSLVRGTLAQAGVKKGDAVGILLPNSADFAAAFLGITTLGAVAVLLPVQLDEMTVFGCCYKFGIHTLITNEGLQDKTNTAVQKLKVNVLTAFEGSPVPAVQNEPDDPCAVLFTGGTTGKSKGALLSHKAVLRGVKNGCYGYPQVFGHRYFLVLPLTHVFGLIRTLLTSLYTGSEIFICRNNKDMFRDMAMFRPTLLVLVPALAEMALGLSKQFGRNMLGDSVKYIICGASAVAPYLVEEYHKLGITLFPGYGLTESANLVSGNPDCLHRPASVGLPYEGQELKIVDGELWLKGENMMLGYFNDPDENQNAYSDGWFRTGDLVRMDDDGFLYIVGRTKEVIVLSSGENISPAEVENKFNAIEAVQDSLVYLTKNDGGAEVLALQVYPRAAVLKGVADPQGLLTEEIQKVNATLPAYQRISKIIIRDTDFVRSPSMKILRDKNAQ